MEKQLITANTWFGSMSSDIRRVMSFETFRSSHLRKLRERFQIEEGKFNEELPPVEAHVEEGAWLVHCPAEDCHGAEYAWEEGFFWCTSCKNSYMKHEYRRSTFPKERARIEELLLRRPFKNRHYLPGEKVKDLERENKEHADELLSVVNSSEGG